MWRFKRWRPEKKDVLFVIGLAGIALEEGRVFGQPSETMVLVFAAMIGLRFAMKADEQRVEEQPPSKPDTPKLPNSSDGNGDVIGSEAGP